MKNYIRMCKQSNRKCLAAFIHTVWLIAFFWAVDASGQDYIDVMGVVTNEQGTPLEYANITVSGQSIGTTTNTSGSFEFHVPREYANDTLIVSFLGYYSYKQTVEQAAIEQPLRIKLKISTYELPELIVSDKPYTVYSLLDEVVKRYDDNYNTKPHGMQAFYREIRQTNGKYGYLLEAACNLYKRSYKLPYIVSIEKVRANRSTSEFNVRSDENFLETLLVNDYVSNSEMGFYKRYSKNIKYVLEDTTSIDGRMVYVVTRGALPFRKETIYINAKDYAIIRYDIEDKYGPDGDSQPKMKIGKDRIGRYKYWNVVNIMGRTGGKYYVRYVKSRLEHEEVDVKKKVVEKSSVLQRELTVNDVNYKDPKEIESSKSMKSIRLDDQMQDYDEQFWKTYNILTRTPVEEKVYKELEQEESMEDQFKKQKASPPRKSRKTN